jgi:hypothetical protein
MLRALGAAIILKSQYPSGEVAVRDLETGGLTEVTTWHDTHAVTERD